MPNPNNGPKDMPHPFFEALQGMPIKLETAQLNDISEKLDRLLEILSPRKSVIITGDEVEQIINQLAGKK